MREKKERRGGTRPGAGRPKGNSKLFSFRCPGRIASILGAMDNRTEFINKSLAKALNDLDDLSDLGEAVNAANVSTMNLPFFDLRVPAGFPVPLDNDEKAQDIELLSMLCPHPESSYLIRIMGDSMIDAGVMSGDIVIVDKSNREPTSKEIAVCEINGEYTLKHLVREAGACWLVPANPNYKRRQVKEGDDFSVWGTVTYIIHKARD